MAGLGLALLGGALRGWGEGQLAAIKAKRDEKLKLLDQQFLSGQNELNRGLQREQIASTERLAEAQRRSMELMQGRQLTSSEKIATAGNLTQLEVTDRQIAGNQKLQEMQEEAQQRLNAKLTAFEDPDNPGTPIYRLMLPNGKMLDNPVDPKTGKMMSLLPAPDDTDDIKNMKELMRFGVPQKEAIDKVFNAKNSNRQLVEAGLIKSMNDGLSTFKNLTEEDIDFTRRKAREITDDMFGNRDTSSSSTVVDPTTIEIPTGMNDDQVRAAIQEALTSGVTKEEIKAALIKNHRKPADFGIE